MPTESASSPPASSQPVSPQPISSSSSSSVSTVPPRVVPHSFKQLEELLLKRVPTGFRAQPDDLYDTGPSNLAKAIRDDGGKPEAARALRAAGFVRGYQRLWVNAASHQILVFVYQFRTPKGADYYYRRSVRKNAASAPADATNFAVPGLPPNRTSAVLQRTDFGRSASAETVTGPLYMLVVCHAPIAGKQIKSRLITLAQEQFNRLHG